MPKVIENLRESLLACARDALLTQGYDHLTIRGVAAACGVAVGTVYNYFPAKDVLVASVMLEDWQRALERMRAGTAAAASALEGLRQVFEAVSAFAGTYSGAWTQYTARMNPAPVLHQRHEQLVEQLNAVLEPLLRRFDCLFDPSLTGFLAETVLSASVGEAARFDDLVPVLHKLLQ